MEQNFKCIDKTEYKMTDFASFNRNPEESPRKIRTVEKTTNFSLGSTVNKTRRVLLCKTYVVEIPLGDE